MASFPDRTTRLQETWLRLPDNLRGMLWVSLAVLLFVGSNTTVKYLGQRIHPVELGLFRYSIGLWSDPLKVVQIC